MEYTELGSDHKRNIIRQKIQNLEAQHYDLDLTRVQLDDADDGSEDFKKAMVNNELTMTTIEAAIEVLRKQLSEL
jgi:hypothetical protein